MTRFEHTFYFRLLRPLLHPVLDRLLWWNDRYVLLAEQILLSGLLCLVVTALQTLITISPGRPDSLMKVTALFNMSMSVGVLLTMFWCIWYWLTTLFGMMGLTQSPARLLSCLLTCGLALRIAWQVGPATDQAGLLLGLLWAGANLRPTLFGMPGSDQPGELPDHPAQTERG